MKNYFLVLCLLFLGNWIQAQTNVTLGHPLSSMGGVDGWNSLLIVDEDAIYTNTSGQNETISIDGFNFEVGNNRGRVTPFIVRINGDNNFTVLSIGKTRVSATDYNATGPFQLDFDDSAPTITILPGETIAPGVMNANPDGSGVVGSVIPYVGAGNEVWITGAGSSGMVSIGNPITNGADIYTGNRNYAFSIDLTVNPLAAIPTLSTWGLIILGLLLLTFSLGYAKNRYYKKHVLVV